MAGSSQVKIEDLSKDDKKADKGGEKKSPPRARVSSATAAKQENTLRTRLTDCFDRIADALGTRGDEELAALVHDDAEIMADGLVAMTRPIKAFRTPLLLLVAIVEPLLAFGRIGRVLAIRWAERRHRVATEQEAAQREQSGAYATN